MKILIFIIVSTSAVASAGEQSDANLDHYRQTISDFSAARLTGEFSYRLGQVGVYCGEAYARKAYEAFSQSLYDGKKIKDTNIGQDPKCRVAQLYFGAAENEVRGRNQKESRSADATTYYNFHLTLPHALSANTQEAGDPACLELARKIDENWRKQVAWPPMDRARAVVYDTSHTKCEIQQTANENIARATCSNWVGSSAYDFDKNLFIQNDREVQVATETDRSQPPTIDSGLYFFYSLRFHPGSKDAVVELRGVDGVSWIDGIYRADKNPINLDAKCAISAPVTIDSTPLQVGRAG